MVFCYVLFIVVAAVFMVFVYYKIFQKTGNSGWLSLLMLIPLVNFIMILYLAFSDWPVLRENRDLKSRMGYGGQGYVPPTGYAPPAQSYAAPPAPPYAGQPQPPQVPPYGQPPSAPQPPQQPPAQP
jgi:hypothetical protein